MADFPSDPRPDYPVDEMPADPDVLVSRHRDGTEQRRYKGAGDRGGFKLSFGGSAPITSTQRLALLNHFSGQSGMTTAFNWTHPERPAETYLVRYAERPAIKLIGLNAYQAEVTFKVVTA